MNPSSRLPSGSSNAATGAAGRHSAPVVPSPFPDREEPQMTFTQTDQESLVNAWLLAREGKGRRSSRTVPAPTRCGWLRPAGWSAARSTRRATPAGSGLAGRGCARHERATPHRPGGPELMSGSPYRLIIDLRPLQDAGHGEVRYFRRCSTPPTLSRKRGAVQDRDLRRGCTARELNPDERRLLENVCSMLGYDVAAVGA